MMQACANGGLWRSAHPRKKKYTVSKSNGYDFEYIQTLNDSIVLAARAYSPPIEFAACTSWL
jgi:hypothetical protein